MTCPSWVALHSMAHAAAKSLQSCPTLRDPIDGSLPGSPIPGILQARTLEWVAISYSNACKWKVKVKSLSRVRLLATPWTAAHQAPPSMDFPGKSTGVGCHCLLRSMAHSFIELCKPLHQDKAVIHEGNTWTENFQIFKLGFKEAEEQEIKLSMFSESWRKQGSSRKTFNSASSTMLKSLTMWITTNGKILKEMGIPDHLTCLLRNLNAGQEAIVRTGHGTTDWLYIVTLLI